MKMMTPPPSATPEDDEQRLRQPLAHEAERDDRLEERERDSSRVAGLRRRRARAARVRRRRMRESARSPATTPSRISTRPSPLRPSVTGFLAARPSSTAQHPRMRAAGVEYRVGGRDQRIGASRDLDVDRHRHVLPQVGRRIGHAQLDFHRAAQRVDARIDVEELGVESLARIRIGRGNRLLPELAAVRGSSRRSARRSASRPRARAPSAPCPAARRRPARRCARSGRRRPAQRSTVCSSRAFAARQRGVRLLERGLRHSEIAAGRTVGLHLQPRRARAGFRRRRGCASRRRAPTG